jgi:hypothetical protein
MYRGSGPGAVALAPAGAPNDTNRLGAVVIGTWRAAAPASALGAGPMSRAAAQATAVTRMLCRDEEE